MHVYHCEYWARINYIHSFNTNTVIYVFKIEVKSYNFKTLKI